MMRKEKIGYLIFREKINDVDRDRPMDSVLKFIKKQIFEKKICVQISLSYWGVVDIRDVFTRDEAPPSPRVEYPSQARFSIVCTWPCILFYRLWFLTKIILFRKARENSSTHLFARLTQKRLVNNSRTVLRALIYRQRPHSCESLESPLIIPLTHVRKSKLSYRHQQLAFGIKTPAESIVSVRFICSAVGREDEGWIKSNFEWKISRIFYYIRDTKNPYLCYPSFESEEKVAAKNNLRKKKLKLFTFGNLGAETDHQRHLDANLIFPSN